MDWIPEFYDPEILKDIEAIEESIASKPGFDSFRREIERNLIKDSSRLSGFTAEEIIKQADTFEELIVLKDYLQARFAGDHVWWDEYHKRRIELAMLPSNYGTIEGKARFALPISPERLKRSNIAGLRGVGVRRNLAGQLFTRRELQGLDPVEISRAGIRFQDFIHGERPPAKSYFAFDLETTGLLKQLAYKNTGNIRGIASLGFSFRNTEIAQEGLSLAKIPSNRPYLGEFIEETILPRHFEMQGKTKAQLGLRRGSIFKNQVDERRIVKQFIETVSRDKNAAIMGYNIEQFDIPFLKVIAKRHGLERELANVLKGRDIIDVGNYAKAFLSEQLGSQYIGWQEGMFKDLKLNPMGWKQQALAHAFGFEGAMSEAAHTPLFDVKMTEHIYETLTKEKGKEAYRLWNEVDKVTNTTGKQRYEQALKSLNQELVGISELEKITVRRGGKTFLNLPEYMIPRDPRSSSILKRLISSVPQGAAKISDIKIPAPSVVRNIFDQAPQRNIGKLLKNNNIVKATKGARFLGLGVAIGAIAPGQGMSNLVGAYGGMGAYYATKAKTSKAGLGIAAGVATYGIVKGLNSLMFSGRDDNYNVIEGLRHGGAAQATRMQLTEFGSGYQGQKLSIYNQDIDPEIQEFRHRWLSTPTREKLLKEEMKKAGENIQQVGDFKASEMAAAGKFQKVNLSEFDWKFEDPDTLMLHRKGLWNIFDAPIAVRMTGIDSPEIEHEDDELEWTRYQQNQPYGQEATARAKELWEGKNGMSVLIDPERRTYGRYLGILQEEGAKESVNVQMIQKGIAAALPWGDSGSDMISRQKLVAAEKKAIAEEQGMWQEEYYQRYLDIAGATGRRITFTSFTDLSRLSKNYGLAAAQELMSRDDVDYQPWMGRYIGAKLRKSYGPNDNKARFSGKDSAYNTIEGIHPGSEGIGAESIRAHTDFGSGWLGETLSEAFSVVRKAGKYDQDVLSNTLDVEFSGQRKRRLKKEKTEKGQYSWIRTAAAKRYSVLSTEAIDDSQYVSKGGWRSTGNGGKFSGMPNESEGAMSSMIRAGLTEFKSEFASRWDPLRKIATELFPESTDALAKLKNMPTFEMAIKKALTTEGKLLGSGKTSKTFAHTASFDLGGKTHSFEFVAKVPRTIDEMVAGSHGQSPMQLEEADMWRRMTLQNFIPKETKALSALEDVSESVAPGYYGQFGDTIVMEKFNITRDFKNTSMSPEQYKDVSSFMKRAHEKGITHTDIHRENLVKVATAEGKEEVALLDWGLAGRLSGQNPEGDLSKLVLVQQLSKHSMGKAINIEDYSKLADLKRLESFSKGEEKLVHHFGINALMTEGELELSKAAIEEVLVFGGGKRVNAELMDFSGPGKVVSDSNAWGMSDFFSNANSEATAVGFKNLETEAPTVIAGRGMKQKVESAFKHMQSVPSLSQATAVERRGLANTKTILHSNELTEIAMPKINFESSRAAELLRTTSDKICRVPFEAADMATKGHRNIASRRPVR